MPSAASREFRIPGQLRQWPSGAGWGPFTGAGYPLSSQDKFVPLHPQYNPSSLKKGVAKEVTVHQCRQRALHLKMAAGMGRVGEGEVL
jgi:hypothetical protein